MQEEEETAARTLGATPELGQERHRTVAAVDSPAPCVLSESEGLTWVASDKGSPAHGDWPGHTGLCHRPCHYVCGHLCHEGHHGRETYLSWGWGRDAHPPNLTRSITVPTLLAISRHTSTSHQRSCPSLRGGRPQVRIQNAPRRLGILNIRLGDRLLYAYMPAN